MALSIYRMPCELFLISSGTPSIRQNSDGICTCLPCDLMINIGYFLSLTFSL